MAHPLNHGKMGTVGVTDVAGIKACYDWMKMMTRFRLVETLEWVFEVLSKTLLVPSKDISSRKSRSVPYILKIVPKYNLDQSNQSSQLFEIE